LAENGIVVVNRADALHPAKLIVIELLAEAPGPMVPSASGNAAGLTITGVHAGPNVCARVKPVI
jgi:hypothetical protein